MRGSNSPPVKKNNNNHHSGAERKTWPREAQHLRPSPLHSPTAAFHPPEPLYADGAEPMNLASQSGDAGGSQLLFANFNQDNT